MPIPDDIEIDDEKLAEIALAIIWLGRHGDKFGTRVWKSMDWDLTDLLFDKGWIDDPKSKAKSVSITNEGLEKAEVFFEKHFAKGQEGI